MKPIPKLLSKTKIMRGYRCHRAIYWTVHSPELEVPVTPAQQAIFDQGNEVGVEARKRFPDGVLVDNKPWDFTGSLKRTRELLAAETPVIFEAAFEHKGCYARADIIQYSKETKRWSIFEVKSSTKLKPEYLDDVGVQAWIMAKSGLPIERICVLHMNSECRYPNLKNLFQEADVTAALREKYPETLPRMNEIFAVLQKSTFPEAPLGPHCLTPGDCGFKDACWKEKNIPEVSVLDLPGLRDERWALVNRGIVDVTDPRLSELNELQARIVESHKTGKRFLNAEGVRAALDTWKFPLVFLDFETINPAIPRFDGCRPYEQVAFQFSVHVWKTPEDTELEHREFLHDGATDPRPSLIPALLEACAGEGSVVAYYSRFERDRIQEMADHFPEWRQALEALTGRLVDPLPVLRENVYDPAFAGSFSLKKTGPGLLGDDASYEGLTVAEGLAAQRAFAEMISPKTPAARRADLRVGLLEYCRKDTLVMVDLVKWLFHAVS